MNYNIKNIPSKELAKGISGRYIHTDHNTIGFITVEKGAILPEHSHIHEQITQMVSGKFEMTIDGVTQILEAGSVCVIPSNVTHSAVALSDCEIIDTFYPVREDYK
ncbi:cupin domain-containing protein [Gaetbulibacter aestuarii]|uniref:Cupin domain-containing protein n=1 Tax=Gaetbulibacter aestuarii TaxID=1502358 RepID=A0ABW7MZD8_9FLAO